MLVLTFPQLVDVGLKQRLEVWNTFFFFFSLTALE